MKELGDGKNMISLYLNLIIVLNNKNIKIKGYFHFSELFIISNGMLLNKINTYHSYRMTIFCESSKSVSYSESIDSK